jgi:hypothetical protein
MRSGSRLGSGVTRVARFVVPGVVGLVAVAGLGVGAVHGARQASSLAGTSEARAWQADYLYYACLDAQAHSLVPPGAHVWIDTRNSSVLYTLEQVLSPWAIVVHHHNQATTWVSLRDATGSGACLGRVVQARYPSLFGPGTITRTGTGGSFPGRRSLPSTPL